MAAIAETAQKKTETQMSAYIFVVFRETSKQAHVHKHTEVHMHTISFQSTVGPHKYDHPLGLGSAGPITKVVWFLKFTQCAC